MKNYTYNFEISTLIAQFMDSLDDVVIKRWDRTASHSDPIQKGSSIRPTILYSPKSRIIHDYINNQAQLKLPVICFHVAGVKRDPSRVFNKIQGPSFDRSYNTSFHQVGQPVPIDISINLSILSKSQEDVDQIITNFIPYCDDYIVVSWPFPYDENQEIRTIIQWSGDVSLTYPTDTTYNDQYRITGDTSFTIKGWLFKSADASDGIIHNITSNFYSVSNIYCDYSSNVVQEYSESTDVVSISGRPFITNVSPYKVFPCSLERIIVTGSMFDYASGGFYLSGVNLSGISYHNLLSTSLSSVITGISGIHLSPIIHSDHVAEFTLPVGLTGTGFFNILAINEAGIGSLMIDSVRSVTYPSPSALEGEPPWDIYQPPCINGVEILNNFTYCE